MSEANESFSRVLTNPTAQKPEGKRSAELRAASKNFMINVAHKVFTKTDVLRSSDCEKERGAGREYVLLSSSLRDYWWLS
jgi:hypothetical protein